MKGRSKKHVLFFIESFGGGGAEKVLLTILERIDYSRFDITVKVFSNVGSLANEFKRLPIKIESIIHDKKSSLKIINLYNKIKYKLFYNIYPAKISSRLLIKKNRYDTIVAFVEGYATKIISNCQCNKKIAWVHIDLKSYPWTLNSKIYKNIEEEINTYCKFSKVICVSKSVKHVMDSYYGLNNTQLIYNPINSESIKLDSLSNIDYYIDNDEFNIIAIGRLVKQKGFSSLLPIIQTLRKEGMPVHLHILGEGPLRKDLEEQIKSLSLEKHVSLKGFQHNPYSILGKMDLMVCPSIAEGYSLVTAEALTLGIPVISMNCSGPNELLGNGKFGILCNDIITFQEAIVRAIKDREYLNTLRQKAIMRSKIFDIGTTIKEIEDIL